MKRFVCKKLLAVGLSVLMLVGMPAVAANVSADGTKPGSVERYSS